jgi:predicted RNA-binding protein associated with RNAse of E/G family
VKKRKLTFDEWSCITEKRVMQKKINETYFTGIVGLICIDEVIKPQYWNFLNKDVLVCDKGMKWLSMIPENEFYVITAMLDSKNNIVLWYIDMIADSGIDEDGAAYYHDLYLDLVVYPDGNIYEDDMDELEEAFYKKEISKDLFDLAIDTNKKLRSSLLLDSEKMSDMTFECLKYFLN